MMASGVYSLYVSRFSNPIGAAAPVALRLRPGAVCRLGVGVRHRDSRGCAQRGNQLSWRSSGWPVGDAGCAPCASLAGAYRRAH